MPKEELKIPKYKNEKGKCPPGHKWDEKKGKCVQKGVGSQYKP